MLDMYCTNILGVECTERLYYMRNIFNYPWLWKINRNIFKLSYNILYEKVKQNFHSRRWGPLPLKNARARLYGGRVRFYGGRATLYGARAWSYGGRVLLDNAILLGLADAAPPIRKFETPFLILFHFIVKPQKFRIKKIILWPRNMNAHSEVLGKVSLETLNLISKVHIGMLNLKYTKQQKIC